MVGVPDSGLVAAMGYSQQSGIPYGTAFHKNSYVGRTFIKPKQSERVSSVKIKLNVIPEVVKGSGSLWWMIPLFEERPVQISSRC